MEQVLGVLAQAVGELDVEGDEDVAALGRFLGQGEAVSCDPLSCTRLYNLQGVVRAEARNQDDQSRRQRTKRAKNHEGQKQKNKRTKNMSKRSPEGKEPKREVKRQNIGIQGGKTP